MGYNIKKLICWYIKNRETFLKNPRILLFKNVTVPVDRVGEAGMVRIQLGSVAQNLVRKSTLKGYTLVW